MEPAIPMRLRRIPMIMPKISIAKRKNKMLVLLYEKARKVQGKESIENSAGK
jgi:hypothetical protein